MKNPWSNSPCVSRDSILNSENDLVFANRLTNVNVEFTTSTSQYINCSRIDIEKVIAYILTGE